ncbi:uncharacterized protein LOC131619374 [Vicia villosa]|uniref:uncharacterized protein LOC131619374 n=1 Tax=Vicia villosa TaxID=3911 RepID=UPI00273B901E|nr:uncharacterized protein LOC131619374 [Vicia villosa]
MEVLTALLNKSKALGEFRGFKIKGNKEVDLLQFADDTLIIAECNLANLWSLKSIFRGFELMSGSRISFHKSNLYGLNAGDWFLEAASSFLSCKVGSLPFKFLGVRVGDNPMKLSMWRDFILMLKDRLSVWRGVHLSIAGRVVLINLVINAIPIYSLFFYKAPKKVLNEVCSIQRKFLWGGGDLKISINWVCWDTVCKSREEGGLGVKNVEIMNVALISKWKWRILTDKEAVCNHLQTINSVGFFESDCWKWKLANLFAAGSEAGEVAVNGIGEIAADAGSEAMMERETIAMSGDIPATDSARRILLPVFQELLPIL